MSPLPSMIAKKSQREIFAAAIACEDPEELQKLLDLECGADTAVRDAVETLLDEHSAIGDFLEHPALEGDRLPLAPPHSLIGKKLGPYTLITAIGEGGGGSVYLAEQRLPVQRQVALKVLKLGLDTESLIARFEAERQTLAKMDHPHIASVIDAGATDEGRPYFVMEYVPGDPVTEYCDKRQLSIEDRLLIFIRICRAIEHAHQKGVIHRDIKPSNILVREQEGESVPKVIDFGVAKAINPTDGDPGGFTMNETIIGTPAYMSPEQASRGNTDLDTRTDVYSLGVILYELLTGTTPLQATRSGMSGTPEALKLLSEVDPPRPSVFLKTLNGEECTSIGRQRAMATGRVTTALQGDLDCIAMKCLEKDRSRRFGSASDLGRDLELYLKGAPITARPPSWRYRLGKFVGRNRIAVASASLLLATLIAAAVMSLIFGVRATKSEETQAKLFIAAKRDRASALKSAENARLHQYVANINLANQALLDGHFSKALLLLEPWASVEPDKKDPRGFEWWFLMEKSLGNEHDSLPRFDGPIESLAFAPDGNELAIASENQVHLWSLAQQKIVSTFPHDARSVQFFSGGDRLVASGQEGVMVFDLTSGDSKRLLRGRDLEIAISSDDRFLATSDRQGVTVWNTSTWRREHFLPEAFGSLAFSPQGDALATDGRDGVTLWPLGGNTSPVVLEESPDLRFGGSRIQYSPDGKFVILARNANPTEAGFSMGLWETESGKEVAMLPRGTENKFHSGAISAMSFNREGSLLATSSWDHSVRLWDFEKRTLSKTFLGHRGEVWSVALPPNGNLIASGSKDGEVRIWPIKTSSRHELIEGSWTPLGFSRDSKAIAAYDRKGAIATFELASGKTLNSQPGSSPDTRVNRGHIVSANQELNLIAEHQGNGMVAIRNLENQSQTILETGIRRIDSLSLSPDGGSLVATSRSDGMTWWDLKNPGEPAIRSEASQAQFSADGSTLVGAHNNGTTVIWDTITRRERNRLQLAARSPGTRMALSHEGKLLAVTHGFQDYENLISLWDTTTGEEVGTLSGHKQGIWSLAFSPDGKTLASTGNERNIRLWNIATRSELLTIKRLGTVLRDLVFSPDGRILMAGSPGFFSDPKIHLFRSSAKKP